MLPMCGLKDVIVGLLTGLFYVGCGVLCQGSWEAQQSVNSISSCCCRVFRGQPPPADAGQRQDYQVRAHFSLVNTEMFLLHID